MLRKIRLMGKKTIGDLVLEFFKKHKKLDLEHGPVVDWVEAQYLRLYGKKPRDIWRQIRKFHQDGLLIKVKKGVYKYDPDYVKDKELHDFPTQIKKAILERDGYRCVYCGRRKEDGVELTVDHITPKDKGGTNTIENGQTLCMQCNLMKKNYSQTEAAKRYFIRLYEKAVSIGDKKMIQFCKQIFDVYNEKGINSHIPRPNNKS